MKSSNKDKITRIVSRTNYLKEILTRLETEYIPILNLIIEYNNKNERKIGFWSLIRIIFPVIESVASIIGKQKEDFLSEDLNVPFGHLVWELYRNALMHTDELRYAVYKGKTISWSAHIEIENKKHFIAKHTATHPTTIHINISQLFIALQEVLIKEIKKGDDSQVNIQVGVHFPDKTKLTNELEELYIKY